MLCLVLIIFTGACFLLLSSYYPIEEQLQWTRERYSWEQIIQERRQRVQNICSKYPGLKLQEIDYRLFKYSPGYHLMFCANAKVGSTTYALTTFKQILEGEDFAEKSLPEGEKKCK